jgi:hypothetical protein
MATVTAPTAQARLRAVDDCASSADTSAPATVVVYCKHLEPQLATLTAWLEQNGMSGAQLVAVNRPQCRLAGSWLSSRRIRRHLSADGASRVLVVVDYGCRLYRPTQGDYRVQLRRQLKVTLPAFAKTMGGWLVQRPVEVSAYTMRQEDGEMASLHCDASSPHRRPYCLGL